MKLLQERIEPGKPLCVKNYHIELIKKEKEKSKLSWKENTLCDLEVHIVIQQGSMASNWKKAGIKSGVR